MYFLFFCIFIRIENPKKILSKEGKKIEKINRYNRVCSGGFVSMQSICHTFYLVEQKAILWLFFFSSNITKKFNRF